MKRCRRCCTRSSPARRKLLTRRGVLVEEEGSTYVADNDGDSDEGRALRPLQAAPGQWPGPPGTNSPLDCLCPGSALANERVQTNAAGQVVLKLKTPWRDGTTHQGTPPLEFMQRLAALVPRPRLHLIRFHGVFRLLSGHTAALSGDHRRHCPQALNILDRFHRVAKFNKALDEVRAGRGAQNGSRGL